MVAWTVKEKYMNRKHKSLVIHYKTFRSGSDADIGQILLPDLAIFFHGSLIVVRRISWSASVIRFVVLILHGDL